MIPNSKNYLSLRLLRVLYSFLQLVHHPRRMGDAQQALALCQTHHLHMIVAVHISFTVNPCDLVWVGWHISSLCMRLQPFWDVGNDCMWPENGVMTCTQWFAKLTAAIAMMNRAQREARIEHIISRYGVISYHRDSYRNNFWGLESGTQKCTRTYLHCLSTSFVDVIAALCWLLLLKTGMCATLSYQLAQQPWLSCNA